MDGFLNIQVLSFQFGMQPLSFTGHYLTQSTANQQPHLETEYLYKI